MWGWIAIDIKRSGCAVLRQGCLTRGFTEVKEKAVFLSGRRVLKAEGTANAKAMRQDQEHRGQCGWNGRADGKRDREGKEAREVTGTHHRDNRTLKAVLRTFYSQ